MSGQDLEAQQTNEKSTDQMNVTDLINKTHQIADACHMEMDEVISHAADYLPDDYCHENPDSSGVPDMDTLQCRKVIQLAKKLEVLQNRLTDFCGAAKL